MLACAAFTSDDLPMPRAPHSSALLAGRPSAKRSVFSIRMSRMRSIPLSRPRSTRLTRGTGDSRPLGCQTKASALAKRDAVSVVSEAAERWAAIASRARAIRSSAPCFDDEDGRFVAAFADLAASDFERARVPVFRGFFDISGVPDDAPISGL